jgi:hypothetical protein
LDGALLAGSEAGDISCRRALVAAAVNFISTRLVEYRANRWVIDAPPLGHACEPRSVVETKGADMLAWLLWQLERIERIRAAAGALMDEFGDEAYGEARRREREASRQETAGDWRRVALVVARRTPRRVRLDAASAPVPELDSPTGVVSEPPRIFRIQFVCGTVDQGPMNLTEKQIQVADAPAAIIAAANIKWPPQTIGLRILDREGHEVFARQKTRRA